jgi:cytochrome c
MSGVDRSTSEKPMTGTNRSKLRMLASAVIGALSLAALAAPVGAQTPAATDSPEYKRGRLLYIQCRACHELKAGQPNKVGPNLHGIIGTRAAQVPGFAYSAALNGANLTWDRATFDKWLERPSALVPGNAMAFAGIANAKDRAALITYVEIESAPAAR